MSNKKFSPALLNNILDQKLTRYLTIENYTTGDKETKFKISRGAAVYEGIPVAQLEGKDVTFFEIPEGSPKYIHIIKHRLTKKAKELGFNVIGANNE